MVRAIGQALFILVLIARIGSASADAALILDEPESVKVANEHRVLVLTGDIAVIRLKWANDTAASKSANLQLSPFKADGHPTVVIGFNSKELKETGPRSYRQNVDVSDKDTEIPVLAPGLVPGVDYVGYLYATVDNTKTFIWELILSKPIDVPVFQCPADPLVVLQDGQIHAVFKKLASLNVTSVTLALSAFTSKDQELGEVGFIAKAPDAASRAQLVGYALKGDNLEPPMRADGLTAGAIYNGNIAFADDRGSLGVCPLSVQMPKRAQMDLGTDSPSLTRSVMLPIWFGDTTDAGVSLRLFEKTRSRRVDGVTATLDGQSDSPDGSINPDGQLDFSVNGTAAPRFLGLEPSAAAVDQLSSYAIPPNGQLDVGLRLRGARAGKYTFALRFYGVDTVNPGPKVDITFNVRHHVLWAILAVLLASALSFFISKGIVNWRERIRIRSRLLDLKAEPFDQHSYLPSYIFLRAVLAQSEKLLHQMWFLPPPPSIYDYLARAGRVVTILRRYSALCASLHGSLCSDSVKYHYYQAINQVMQRIGPQALDQKTTDGIIEDLGVIDSRLSDPTTWYWATLKAEATSLVAQARSVQADLGDPAVVGPLLTQLENFPATVTQSVDQTYWMVKLLYSRRAFRDDVTQLTAEYAIAQNLADTLKLADELAWGRVTVAVKAKRVRVRLVDAFEAPESLRPIKFMLEFDDPAIAESYLIGSILQYKWTFSLVTRGIDKPKTWSLKVNGPRITQYMPLTGRLTMGATLEWPAAGGALTQELEPIELDIGDNSDLSLANNLNGSEIALLFIVTLVALVTGLSSLYFGKPTFGSFADYIAILAWAIGVDQGRNLIQLLKSSPVDGDTAASSTGT